MPDILNSLLSRLTVWYSVWHTVYIAWHTLPYDIFDLTANVSRGGGLSLNIEFDQTKITSKINGIEFF